MGDTKRWEMRRRGKNRSLGREMKNEEGIRGEKREEERRGKEKKEKIFVRRALKRKRNWRREKRRGKVRR